MCTTPKNHCSERSFDIVTGSVWEQTDTHHIHRLVSIQVILKNTEIVYTSK